MPKNYPYYPSVDSSLRETRDYAFRGNTFGQLGDYRDLSSEDREIASRFNIEDEIKKAEEIRKKAGFV